jgi:hypothetical protein
LRFDTLEKEFGGGAGKFGGVLADGGEGSAKDFGKFEVVEADEGNLGGHSHFVCVERADELNGRDALDSECGSRSVL